MRNPFWRTVMSCGKQDTVVGCMFVSCCQVPGDGKKKKSWLRLSRNIPRWVINWVTYRMLLVLSYSRDEWLIHAIEHGWIECENRSELMWILGGKGRWNDWIGEIQRIFCWKFPPAWVNSHCSATAMVSRNHKAKAETWVTGTEVIHELKRLAKHL